MKGWCQPVHLTRKNLKALQENQSFSRSHKSSSARGTEWIHKPALKITVNTHLETTSAKEAKTWWSTRLLHNVHCLPGHYFEKVLAEHNWLLEYWAWGSCCNLHGGSLPYRDAGCKTPEHCLSGNQLTSLRRAVQFPICETQGRRTALVCSLTSEFRKLWTEMYLKEHA